MKQSDIAGYNQISGDVITGAIENQNGMGTRGDLFADLDEVTVQGCSICERHDKRGRCAAGGTDSTEYIGPFIALIARGTGSCTSFGPDASQGSLLADTCLVLEPDLDRFASSMLGENGRHMVGKVFL